MAFCIKCGVELADSEDRCPLCDTLIYHPDFKRQKAKSPYPRQRLFEDVPSFNRSGLLFIFTAIFFLGIVIPILCDFSLTGGMTWSHYVWSSIVLIYVLLVLPLWFKNPNPVIFIPVDYAAVGVFMFFLCFLQGGDWFLTFALTVVGWNALVVSTVTALIYYVRKGYLYIYGGAILATGFFAVLTEILLNYTFGFRPTFSLVWSFYPLVAFFVIGMCLIIIAISRPLRESLYKKFFL